MSRVLVVDDEPGLRQSLGLLLTDAGYDVAAEGDGKRGLERALAESFDLILCDVRMPGLDGIAFLRGYRERGGEGLGIMMTRPSPPRSRYPRRNAIPSSPGIRTSHRIKSNDSARARSRPRLPSPSAATSYPASVRSRPKDWRRPGSSSTTKTRLIPHPPPHPL